MDVGLTNDNMTSEEEDMREDEDNNMSMTNEPRDEDK